MASPVSPVNIPRGPAWISWNGLKIYTKDVIAVEVDSSPIEIETSAYGPVDQRFNDRVIKISFVPVGQWGTTYYGAAGATLWPYTCGSVAVGTSLSTQNAGSSYPMVINSLSGSAPLKITLPNAFITKEPSIMLTPSKTQIGACEFTALGTIATAWSGAGSLFAEGSATVDPATFSDSTVPTQAWTGSFSNSVTNFSVMDTTDDGFSISTELKIAYIKTNVLGTVDATFGGAKVTASFTPVGQTEADYLNWATGWLQGAGAVRGASLNAFSATGSGNSPGTFVLTGSGGNSVTINGAAPTKFGLHWGSTDIRNAPIGFVSTRNFAAGVPAVMMVLS